MSARKHLVVLGAGTAGTMAVNKLRPRLPRETWDITVVEPSDAHRYQPGYLFLPFGAYTPEEVVEPTDRFLPEGVTRVREAVERVDADAGIVTLASDATLGYDYLVIATGTSPRPDQTPGMDDPAVWRSSVHEFYTMEGALALRDAVHQVRLRAGVHAGGKEQPRIRRDQEGLLAEAVAVDVHPASPQNSWRRPRRTVLCVVRPVPVQLSPVEVKASSTAERVGERLCASEARRM